MLDDDAHQMSPGSTAFCLVIMARMPGEGSSLEIVELVKEPDWSVETTGENVSWRLVNWMCS